VATHMRIYEMAFSDEWPVASDKPSREASADAKAMA
jgi:hypothetical protein